MTQEVDHHTTIYRPNQRHGLGLLTIWILSTTNILRSRDLIWQLFKRDFLAVYKKSFIGWGWIVISPIAGIVSWVFMQMTGLLNPGDVGIPYPAYVLIGTSMWGLFMGFYSSAEAILEAGRDLIMQVNYPHEVLIVKTTAQQMANFLIAFWLNIVVLICFKIVPAWQMIFFPLVILPMFFLGVSIGLIVSMISVVAIDIKRVINMAMGLLFFVTPVVYSSNVDSQVVRTIIRWNPLTYLVCSARDIIIYGRLYDNQGYFISAAGALLVFLFSWKLFYVSEQKVVERMI